MIVLSGSDLITSNIMVCQLTVSGRSLSDWLSSLGAKLIMST